MEHVSNTTVMLLNEYYATDYQMSVATQAQ